MVVSRTSTTDTFLYICFFYFARYSLIPAAAFLPSPIGICRFASKLEFRASPKLARSGRIFFLFCKIFVDTCSCFSSFAHRYLPHCVKTRVSGKPKTRPLWANIFFYFARYSLIPAAAFLPSPIAKITVAAPRTMSPPAHTFVLLVACFSSTVM